MTSCQSNIFKTTVNEGKCNRGYRDTDVTTSAPNSVVTVLSSASGTPIIVGLIGRNLTPFIQLYNVKRYLNRNGSTHQGDQKEMCFYESFGSVNVLINSME